jgi:hypothetical protein
MKAFIITLENNPGSREAAAVCLESALKHGYCAELFRASTGVDGVQMLSSEGIAPVTANERASEVLRSHQAAWLSKPGTIGCYASHYRLWKLCAELDEPIVVFEHDALVLAPFPAIDWEGVLHFECEGNLTRVGTDWASGDRMETGTGVYRLGFSPAELPELVCIPCCHAYAIKPHAARALVEDARTNGWLAADRAVREPVVSIETHNPSLATFQSEFMYVSTTSPRRWRDGVGKRLRQILAQWLESGLRVGRSALPKPVRHFLWVHLVASLHARLSAGD